MAKAKKTRDMATKAVKAVKAVKKTKTVETGVKKVESLFSKLRIKWETTIAKSVGPTPGSSEEKTEGMNLAANRIKSRIMRDVLPLLLENQEAFFNIQYMIAGQTAVTSDEKVDKETRQMIFDVICKAIVRMSTPQLISVQAMQSPVSPIFFMKYVFEQTDASKESFEYGVRPISEVVIKIDSQPCSAVTETLKTPWLMDGEAMQDLIAVRDVDAINSLKEIMVSNLVELLDMAVMKRLFDGLVAAGKVEEIGPSRGSGTRDFSEAFNKLHRTCLRQPDFIVGSPDVISSLIPVRMDDRRGIFYVGEERTLRLHVWCDTMMPANGAILGRMPSSLLDSGFVWAPFVPIVLMPGQMDNSLQVPHKRVATRHAMALFDPNRFLVLKFKGGNNA